MSLRRILTGAGLSLGLVLTFSAATLAQQQQQPAQQDGTQKQWEGRGRHRGMGKRGHGGAMRLFSKLNLSDAQQQQLRAIEERYEANIRPQREEMRRLHENNNQGELSPDAQARAQQLRTEMRQGMKGMREEMLAVLTPEQRTQLEQLMKERKARHEERRGRRMDQQNNDDQ